MEGGEPLRLAPRVRAATARCSSRRATGSSYRDRRRTSPIDIGKVVRINPDGSVPRGQSVRRPRRRAAGDLVVRPSQHAGRRAPSRDRAAVDRRARRARRRRAESSRGGQELRLAGDHLRRGLLRRQDRRGHGEGGDGAAGLLLGSGDRAVGDGVLHRRRVSGMEGERVRRLAAAGRAGAAGARRTAGSSGRSATSASSASGSATCSRGRTGSCTW